MGYARRRDGKTETSVFKNQAQVSAVVGLHRPLPTSCRHRLLMRVLSCLPPAVCLPVGLDDLPVPGCRPPVCVLAAA